jgi:hypothetical protein
MGALEVFVKPILFLVEKLLIPSFFLLCATPLSEHPIKFDKFLSVMVPIKLSKNCQSRVFDNPIY